jgi:endonuclease YncB( thermonuclease family)
MRKLLIAGRLAFASAVVLVGGGDSLPGPVPARVLEVVDGDTIKVRARVWLGQEVETNVRLAGIDAPELHGRCPRERAMAEDAKRYLAGRIGNQDVRLRDVRFDKYGGRVLATVETPRGEDLAQGMVAAGLARRYGGETRQPWCAATERG